jgi:hypothetical protein
MQLSPETKQIITDVMQGKYNDNPIIQSIQRMIFGKSPKERAMILTNILRSRGINVDELRFTKEELRSWGLID